MKVDITLQVKGLPVTFYYINAISPSGGNSCTVYSNGNTFECSISYDELFMKLRKQNESNK
jgi:hypothetical protein